MVSWNVIRVAGFVSLLLVSAVRTGFAVEIVAHRGASVDAPENTLTSMRLAWKQAADAVEFDLWLSKDGKVIVFHDSDTKRFEKTPRKILGLTQAEALAIDVGSWKGSEFKGEPIPTLESILGTIPKGHRAVIELKCGPEIVPELDRVLRASGRLPEELAIISFKRDTLAASKKAMPGLQHYFLHDYSKDTTTGAYPDLKDLIALAKAHGFDGLDLQHEWPIDAEFVRTVRSAGLKLLVWTVDDPDVARRLTKAGVDGITTNKPGWLRGQLD